MNDNPEKEGINNLSERKKTNEWNGSKLVNEQIKKNRTHPS